MQAGNGISDLNQGVDTRRTLTRARFEAPAVAGAVMSGAPGRRNLSHAPGAGSRSTEFALKRADPFCNGRSQGKMNLSIIFACGAVGTHQGVLMSGIFLVEIHVRSPACAAVLQPDRGYFLDQSTIAATRRRSSIVESMAEKVIFRSMGSWPATALRGETAWRLAALVLLKLIFSLRAAMWLPLS